MTAKANADIKPTGMRQTDVVDLLYQIVAGLQGLCQKLDDDAGVTDTDYESLCVTALFNVEITNTAGDFLNLSQTQSNTIPPTVIITPNGIGHLADLIYHIFNSIHVLTAKLDADCTFTNYEALAYTAIMDLQAVVNSKGNELGGTSATVPIYKFSPQGQSKAEINEFLYNVLKSIYTMVHADTGVSGLDEDGGVTDTDYESIWFTNWFDWTVENRKGDRIGN
jgi:hypothetical protein